MKFDKEFFIGLLLIIGILIGVIGGFLILGVADAYGRGIINTIFTSSMALGVFFVIIGLISLRIIYKWIEK